jgi:hypothetical protein
MSPSPDPARGVDGSGGIGIVDRRPAHLLPRLSGVLMSSSTTGLFAGLLLAMVAAVAGFGWFLLAILFAAVGYVVGAHLEGRINLTALVPGRGRG